MAPDDRLDRIESKVDTLVDAMTQIVRFEEKISSHQAGMERFGFRLDDIEERVEQIEKRVPVYDLWSGWANKILMIVVGLLITALVSMVVI